MLRSGQVLHQALQNSQATGSLEVAKRSQRELSIQILYSVANLYTESVFPFTIVVTKTSPWPQEPFVEAPSKRPLLSIWGQALGSELLIMYPPANNNTTTAVHFD